MRLSKVIEYVKGCDHRGCTSITIYNPHSFRTDARQLEFDYKLRPSTVEEMLEVLHAPIGMEYLGWRGELHRMDEKCHVYLGSPNEMGNPLTKLLLQHIMGYVYVQDIIDTVTCPYLAGDRKKLQGMHNILMSASDGTDMAPVWELAIAMQTRVGHHSPEGYLENLRSLKGVHGDLMDARSYYEDLCARLGEVEYPYTYKAAHD